MWAGGLRRASLMTVGCLRRNWGLPAGDSKGQRRETEAVLTCWRASELSCKRLPVVYARLLVERVSFECLNTWVPIRWRRWCGGGMYERGVFVSRPGQI